MRRGMRRWAAVGLLAAITVAGCSGADQDDSADDEVQTIGEPAAPAVDGADGGGGAPAREEAAEADQGEAPAGEGTAGGDGTTDGTSVAVGAETAGRDVIRRADMTVASDDPERTADDIAVAARDAGGFVSDTDLRREGGVLAGTVTVRVPTSELSDTLARIEAAGTEVRSRSLSSEDVTGQLTDIAAQLRNLRALETQLLELLSDARETGGTEQVLVVFDRIRDVRDEIERLEGRQENLDDLVALATVTVHIEPTADLLARTAPQRDPEPEPWSLGRQVEMAWDSTVQSLQNVVDGMVVVAVTGVPITLVVVLPFVVVGLAVRALWRRRGAGRGPMTGAPVPSSGPDRD